MIRDGEAGKATPGGEFDRLFDPASNRPTSWCGHEDHIAPACSPSIAQS